MGKTVAIDGSSRAPSLAHVSAVYEEDRRVGYRATLCPVPLRFSVTFREGTAD